MRVETVGDATLYLGDCRDVLPTLPAAAVVCDPFMGSGTTGVACAQLGRKFIGIELEPQYFDMACERIHAEQSKGRLFA